MNPGRKLDEFIADKLKSHEPIPYSTDVHAAMKLLEKLGYSDWQLYVEKGQQPTCTIYVRDTRNEDAQDYTALGNSVPHAICMACIEVMGWE